MKTSSVFSLAALLGGATAHTYIWGVFVNGVDQGTYNGIRLPAYNGPPPRGYSNSPVKDLDSIDIRCNVLGDRQVPYTIQVEPGDQLTFDWHHDYRNAKDDVIADSHHGPALIYMSPDPPSDNSFVKIWEKGLYELSDEEYGAGKWATTSDIAANGGKMNMRIPEGLKAGYYLVRAELIGLHESDVAYAENPIRGAQFYPNCVQIEVVGNGTVELPPGVSFPGAYNYDDPGVVYDIYCSTETTRTTPCPTGYKIPGPTVWSGAFAETTELELGPAEGATKGPDTWGSWIEESVVTSATFDEGGEMTVLGSETYTAMWSETYQTPGPTVA